MIDAWSNENVPDRQVGFLWGSRADDASSAAPNWSCMRHVRHTPTTMQGFLSTMSSNPWSLLSTQPPTLWSASINMNCFKGCVLTGFVVALGELHCARARLSIPSVTQRKNIYTASKNVGTTSRYLPSTHPTARDRRSSRCPGTRWLGISCLHCRRSCAATRSKLVMPRRASAQDD